MTGYTTRGGAKVMMTKQRWTRSVAALGLVGLLAGCGSTAAPQHATAGAAQGGSTAAQQKQPNDLLAKVERSGTLSMAASAFAPQDFQDPKTKQWTGYDINILKGFAKTLGAKLKIDSLPFSASIQAVGSRRDDMTIDIYYKASRAKVVAFSRPMLNYLDVVAVNSQHPEVAKDTVAALSGKRIAGVTGSAEVAEIKKIPNAHPKLYNSVAESFLALSSGRVAADLQPDADVEWAIRKTPSLKIRILGPVPKQIAPPVQSLRGYYGVPKGSYSKRFLAKLNAYLKKIECNGQEQKILDTYGFTSKLFLKGICSAPNVYTGTGQ